MAATEVRTIVLANGETISGRLVPLTSARFLVQTDKLCLRLAEDEIQSVDGQTEFRRIAGKPPEEVSEASYFHDVRPDGGGTDWVWSREIHRGPEPRTGLTFAFGRADRPLTAAERQELGQVLQSTEYRDRWGNQLPMTTEETDKGWKYEVRFNTPVLSGEPFELVHQATWPRWGRREGEEWVRSHFIRPSGRTLVAIAIRLPAGAAYTRTEPAPLWRMALNGREQAGWRRYLEAEESFMPVVRYRLD
jgi:hypothetical protein